MFSSLTKERINARVMFGWHLVLDFILRKQTLKLLRVPSQNFDLYCYTISGSPAFFLITPPLRTLS